MSNQDESAKDAELVRQLAICEAREDRDGLAGPIAELLRRAGAFAYDYAVVDGEEDWTDWNGAIVGRGPRTVTRSPETLDPQLPFARLEPLLGYGRFARTLVAEHPATPVSVVEEIALAELDEGGANHRLLRAAAKAGAALERLAEHPDKLVRSAVARCPTASAAVQVRLARDPERDVRNVLAASDGLASEARAILALDPDMVWPLALRKDASDEDIRRAAEPGHPTWRQLSLARLPRVPSDVVDTLIAEKDQQVLRVLEARTDLLPEQLARVREALFRG